MAQFIIGFFIGVVVTVIISFIETIRDLDPDDFEVRNENSRKED